MCILRGTVVVIVCNVWLCASCGDAGVSCCLLSCWSLLVVVCSSLAVAYTFKDAPCTIDVRRKRSLGVVPVVVMLCLRLLTLMALLVRSVLHWYSALVITCACTGLGPSSSS